jgi:hypothetical protein
MAIRKVEIHVTKYYLLSWLFGLTGLACQYYNHNIVAIILYIFCYSYSIADFQTPPIDSPPDEPLDNNDIKPS